MMRQLEDTDLVEDFRSLDGWSFVKFKLNIDLVRFLVGIGYERCIEYPWVFKALNLNSASKMLDVGSGSTIFPLYVRKEVGCSVTCIDMDSKLLRLKDYAKKMGLGSALNDGTLDIRVTESPALTFEDNTFDGIACISTIEHSPGDSDLQTMLELVRVTKPGGILAFSVPIAKEHIDVFVKDRVYNREYSGDPVFYEHQYDKKSLFARLIEPSGCEVVGLQAFGETGYSFGKHVVFTNTLKIGAILQPLRWTLPWIVKKFYKPIDMENCPERSFCCFALRKPQ